MPLTIPVVPMVAIDVLLLVHDPLVDVVARGVVWPMHRPSVPVMGAGAALMVIDSVTVQPEPREYVMVTVPEITPDTIPVDEPTLAIAVLLLAQRPPGTALPRATVSEEQRAEGPAMADGDALTVIVLVV